MQPSPGRLVAAQTQNPLQPYGAGTVLLAGDGPHRPEPECQRFACVLENSPRCHRTLVVAPGTLQQNLIHRPSLLPTAPWAAKTIRPPQPDQILPTCRLGRETRLKFGQISRIALHRTPYYILGLPESSEYPNRSNWDLSVKFLIVTALPAVS